MDALSLDDRTAWIQRIEAAFKDVKLGVGMSLLETEWAWIDGTVKSVSKDVPVLTASRAEARKLDLDAMKDRSCPEDWRVVEFGPEELVYLSDAGGGPLALDAEGWRFYVPAAMRAYLLQPEFYGTPLEHEFSLCMVECKTRKCATFYAALSEAQLAVVKDFVELLESRRGSALC